MAYSFVGFVQYAENGGAALARPTGTATGDLMIAQVTGLGDTFVGPSDWTLVASIVGASGPSMAIWTKVVAANESGTYLFQINGNSARRTTLTISSHRGVTGEVDFASLSQSGTNSLRTGQAPASKFPAAPILYIGSISALGAQVQAANGGQLYRAAPSAPLVGQTHAMFQSSGGTPPAATNGTTFTGSDANGNDRGITGGTLLLAVPNPPYAPALASPSPGQVVDRSVTQRFQWVHSDPNGDTQAGYSLRYKITSSSAWTVLSDTTSNQYRDIPAGTFAAGDYEWQVATTDPGGLTGDYSSSGFFTAREAPSSPSITAPPSGSTAGPTPVTLSWTASEQDAYQWRRVADASGAPAGGTVYQDSGVIVSSGDRSTRVSFPVNLRTEWIQLRVRRSGLWSTWASTRQVVNYTPPPVPTVALSTDPATASVLVLISDPTPTGNQPPVAYHDVYVNDGDGEERRATGVAGSWRHWTPRSGRDYRTNIRVVAVGQTGATSSATPA